MADSVADDDASLASYKRMFTEAADLTRDARKLCLQDLKYYHGKQWSSEDLAVLRKRKQPDSVHNMVRVSVNGSLGVLKMGATDPRAWGRNPGDEDAAEVASRVLRYVADLNDIDTLRIDVARDYLIPGSGAVLVGVDERRRPTVQQIRWEEFFYDPRARKADFSDARYLGIAKWMYADDVAAMYPEHKGQIEASLTGENPLVLDETFLDRPEDSQVVWLDGRRRRIMVVEIYHREGSQWMHCVFYAGGLLMKEVSPWLDLDKRPSCPIVAQSCYVDEENNRYGIVRDMISPQDGINKRNSKLLHILNNRQMRASDQAYEGSVDIIREEAARPDGVIPFGWDAVSPTDMAAGQFNLLANDMNLMERLGPSPSVLGRQSAESSGRAQLVRQQAGLTEQAVVFGGIESWELRLYRTLWARCKQFWTAPDYVRVTDDQKAPEYIGINQPRMGPPQVVMGPDGMPAIQPTILGYENALAEMDVDITIDTVPDTANMAQEQFLALVDLASKGVALPPEILIEASSLPKKRELLERLKAASEQPNPQAEVAMADAQSKVEKTQSETALNVARIQDMQFRGQMDAFSQGVSAAQPAAGA